MKRKKKVAVAELVDLELVDGLERMRHTVENKGTPALRLIGSTTKGLPNIEILTYGAWKIGYKIDPIAIGHWKRTIYMKLPGERIMDIPVREMNPIKAAINIALVDQGNDEVQDDFVAYDTIRMTQEFMILYRYEKNLRVIVPGSRS